MKALELAEKLEALHKNYAISLLMEMTTRSAAAELRRLAAVEAELERIKALEPVAWRSRVKGVLSWWVELKEPPERPQQETQPLYALGSKT